MLDTARPSVVAIEDIDHCHHYDGAVLKTSLAY